MNLETVTVPDNATYAELKAAQETATANAMQLVAEANRWRKVAASLSKSAERLITNDPNN